MQSVDNREVKDSSRRSRRIKNLEEEVEFILSQDESDDEGGNNENIFEISKTPSRQNKITEAFTPSASQGVLHEILQTPRRSCRKSIRPTQDYDDIVNKSLRSCTRSARKHLLTTEEGIEEVTENEESAMNQPKWTPAKVGRISQKRGRKSKRNVRANKKADIETNDEEADNGDMKTESQFNTEESKNKYVNQPEISKDVDFNIMKEKTIFEKSEVDKQENLPILTEIEQSHGCEGNEDCKFEQKEGIKADVFCELYEKPKDVGVNIWKEKEVFEKNNADKQENLNILMQNGHNDECECAEDYKFEKKAIEEDICEVHNQSKDVDVNITKEKGVFDKNKDDKEENLNILMENELHDEYECDEDCKLEQNPIEEDICVVYETNITNTKIKEEKDNIELNSSQTSLETEELENNFGSYLKSKEINFSDLGLNPLKYEEEEKEVTEVEIQMNSSEKETAEIIEVEIQMKSSEQETDEMPSLIFCDYDDDDEGCNIENRNNKLNETFEAVDSVKIIKENLENYDRPTEEVEKSNEDFMESLQLSDDDDSETPKKCPRVVLTDTENINQTVLTTPTRYSAIKTNVSSTPKALRTPKLSSTPKQSAKAFRFPTPYRNKQNFKFNNEVKETATRKTPNKNIAKNSLISVTTLKPKEIVLRGIRKRSLSVCIDGKEDDRKKLLPGPLEKVKQDRIVSFYSPANQTTIIDDLDDLIAKSLKKQKPQELNDKFVTTRRKRSMSFDESIISTSLISKLPRPVVNQNIPNKPQSSSNSSKPLSRTKLPNFAAIHEKQFKKMENLVEHVNRKQERSKNLINSETKLRPVSAQKNISIIKNSNNITADKPKAFKKIDLGTTTQMNRSILNKTSSMATLNRTQEQSSTKVINLPDPRLGVVSKPIKSATISHRQPQQQQMYKYLKPSQATNIEKPKANNKTVPIKKTFNLSTSLMVKPSTSANTSCINNADKTTSRLQRHMDLFKGRVPSTQAGVTSRKNEVILKGVRSNRRFELQMQHRKNMEQ